MKRKCSKCQIEKYFADFPKDATQPQGYGYYCKLCDRQAQKSRLRIKKKIYSKWGVEGDPSCYVEDVCEICGCCFHPKNKNNKRCPDCQKAGEKVYYSISSRVGRNYKNYRREKVAHVDLVEITKKYISTKSCPYCGKNFTKGNPKSLDHIIPSSLGGTNEHANINICCLICNISRGNLLLVDWFDLCSSVSSTQAKNM